MTTPDTTNAGAATQASLIDKLRVGEESVAAFAALKENDFLAAATRFEQAKSACLLLGGYDPMAMAGRPSPLLTELEADATCFDEIEDLISSQLCWADVVGRDVMIRISNLMAKRCQPVREAIAKATTI